MDRNGRPGGAREAYPGQPVAEAATRPGRAPAPARGRAVGELVDIEQIVAVASQFYLQGRTQVEIAREMGLDPSTVSRYLKRARDERIVRIDIRAPRLEEAALGVALAERFGLSRAIAVPSDAGTMEPVASRAADHVASLLRCGMRLGVSWGQTLSALVQRLPPGVVSDLDVAQMAGGLSSTTPGVQGAELVRRVAELYPPSQVHYLHAPAIVDSDEIQRAIASDRSVQAALSAAADSELALVGIGTLAGDATLVRGGHLSTEDRLLLLDHGAVGNVNTRFFDEAGQPVTDLDERTVALGWDDLQAIPTVVAVAGGLAKSRAILGALRTGCIDVLVTDAPTARVLLESTALAQ